MKSHFGLSVLLQICCIFSEQLFLGTTLNGCSCLWSFLHNKQNSSNHAKTKIKNLTTNRGMGVRTSIHWEKTSRSSDHSHLPCFETLHTKDSSLCIGYLYITIKLLLISQPFLIIKIKVFYGKLLIRRLRWSTSLTSLRFYP